MTNEEMNADRKAYAAKMRSMAAEAVEGKIEVQTHGTMKDALQNPFKYSAESQLILAEAAYRLYKDYTDAVFYQHLGASVQEINEGDLKLQAFEVIAKFLPDGVVRMIVDPLKSQLEKDIAGQDRENEGTDIRVCTLEELDARPEEKHEVTRRRESESRSPRML
jgi:hypothetical protein